MSSKIAKASQDQDRPVLSFGRFETALLSVLLGVLASAVITSLVSDGWGASSITPFAIVLLLIGGAGILWNAFTRTSLLRRREEAYRSALRAADRFEKAAGTTQRINRN